jgi:hypothetical protein
MALLLSVAYQEQELGVVGVGAEEAYAAVMKVDMAGAEARLLLRLDACVDTFQAAYNSDEMSKRVFNALESVMAMKGFGTKTTSDVTFNTSLDHKVTVSDMLWVAGCGDAVRHPTHALTDQFTVMIGSASRFHETLKPLIADLEPHGATDTYMEILVAKGYRGFLVSLETPTPKEWSLDGGIGSNVWTHEDERFETDQMLVYVDDLAALPPLMAEFRSKVLERSLEKHVAEQNAASRAPGMGN